MAVGAETASWSTIISGRRHPLRGTSGLAAHGTIACGRRSFTIHLKRLHRPDRFAYSAGSGALVGASTLVSIDVAQINDAVDDSYTTNDNQTLSVPASIGLLNNDVIAAGETVTILLDTQPVKGQLAVEADGGFVYVPSGTADGPVPLSARQ